MQEDMILSAITSESAPSSIAHESHLIQDEQGQGQGQGQEQEQDSDQRQDQVLNQVQEDPTPSNGILINQVQKDQSRLGPPPDALTQIQSQASHLQSSPQSLMQTPFQQQQTSLIQQQIPFQNQKATLSTCLAINPPLPMQDQNQTRPGVGQDPRLGSQSESRSRSGSGSGSGSRSRPGSDFQSLGTGIISGMRIGAFSGNHPQQNQYVAQPSIPNAIRPDPTRLSPSFGKSLGIYLGQTSARVKRTRTSRAQQDVLLSVEDDPSITYATIQQRAPDLEFPLEPLATPSINRLVSQASKEGPVQMNITPEVSTTAIPYVSTPLFLDMTSLRARTRGQSQTALEVPVYKTQIPHEAWDLLIFENPIGDAHGRAEKLFRVPIGMLQPSGRMFPRRQQGRTDPRLLLAPPIVPVSQKAIQYEREAANAFVWQWLIHDMANSANTIHPSETVIWFAETFAQKIARFPIAVEPYVYNKSNSNPSPNTGKFDPFEYDVARSRSIAQDGAQELFLSKVYREMIEKGIETKTFQVETTLQQRSATDPVDKNTSYLEKPVQHPIMYLFLEKDEENYQNTRLYMTPILKLDAKSAEEAQTIVSMANLGEQSPVERSFLIPPSSGEVATPSFVMGDFYEYDRSETAPTERTLQGTVLFREKWTKLDIPAERHIITFAMRLTTPYDENHRLSAVQGFAEASNALVLNTAARRNTQQLYWTSPTKNGKYTPVQVYFSVTAATQQYVSGQAPSSRQIKREDELWRAANAFLDTKLLDSAYEVDPTRNTARGFLELIGHILPVDTAIYDPIIQNNQIWYQKRSFQEMRLSTTPFLYEAARRVREEILKYDTPEARMIAQKAAPFAWVDMVHRELANVILTKTNELQNLDEQDVKLARAAKEQENAQVQVQVQVQDPSHAALMQTTFSLVPNETIHLSIDQYQKLERDRLIRVYSGMQDTRRPSTFFAKNEVLDLRTIVIAQSKTSAYVRGYLETYMGESGPGPRRDGGTRISTIEGSLQMLFVAGETYLLRLPTEHILIHVYKVTPYYLEIDASVSVQEILSRRSYKSGGLTEYTIGTYRPWTRDDGDAYMQTVLSHGESSKIPSQRGRLYIDAFEAYTAPEFVWVSHQALRALDRVFWIADAEDFEKDVMRRIMFALENKETRYLFGAMTRGTIRAVSLVIGTRRTEQPSLVTKRRIQQGLVDAPSRRVIDEQAQAQAQAQQRITFKNTTYDSLNMAVNFLREAIPKSKPNPTPNPALEDSSERSSLELGQSRMQARPQDQVPRQGSEMLSRTAKEIPEQNQRQIPGRGPGPSPIPMQYQENSY